LVLAGAALVGLALGAYEARGDEVASLMESGHWRRARVAAEAAVKARPNDPVAVRQLSEILQVHGEMDQALALAEKAIALAPKDAAARYRLAEVYGEKAQKAGMLGKLGLAKRFKKEAEAALALDPNSFEANNGLMEFHLQAPGIAGGDKKQAAKLLEKLVQLDPAKGVRARVRYASALHDTGGVEKMLRDGVAAHPDDYALRADYASWCAAPWRTSKAAEAETQARAAIALDPQRSGAYAVLVIAQGRAKRWDDVERTLAESEARIPDNLGAWYQAGRIALVEAADPQRAEKYLRHYLTQPPELGTPGHAAARWRLSQALE
jgi:tetratricopeptide (TPR) repeat protein